MHTHTFTDGREDQKFIGLFSSTDRAQHEIELAGSLEGFRDAKEGFAAYLFELTGRPSSGAVLYLLWRLIESGDEDRLEIISAFADERDGEQVRAHLDRAGLAAGSPARYELWQTEVDLRLWREGYVTVCD
jgi:hypothetical protein